MLQIILGRSNRSYALDKRIYCATCRFCTGIISTYKELNVTNVNEKLIRDGQPPLILCIERDLESAKRNR